MFEDLYLVNRFLIIYGYFTGSTNANTSGGLFGSKTTSTNLFGATPTNNTNAFGSTNAGLSNNFYVLLMFDIFYRELAQCHNLILSLLVVYIALSSLYGYESSILKSRSMLDRNRCCIL